MFLHGFKFFDYTLYQSGRVLLPLISKKLQTFFENEYLRLFNAYCLLDFFQYMEWDGPEATTVTE